MSSQRCSLFAWLYCWCMSSEHETCRDREPSDVDPQDFLRALMHISPEDAEKAREQSPATRPTPSKTLPKEAAENPTVPADDA